MQAPTVHDTLTHSSFQYNSKYEKLYFEGNIVEGDEFRFFIDTGNVADNCLAGNELGSVISILSLTFPPVWFTNT
jgi:hypothetical protein